MMCHDLAELALFWGFVHWEWGFAHCALALYDPYRLTITRTHTV
jgi:hypothetical protein